MGRLGATAALLIGGTLTELLGWEWIFFLNLPVATGLFVLAPQLLDESRDHGPGSRGMDPLGAVTLTLSLVLLCYAIVEAPEAGWASAQTIGSVTIAAVFAGMFYRTETRSAAPLVPLHMFRTHRLVSGNAVMLLIGVAAWGVGLVTSLYAQRVLGYSPLVYGLGTAALTVMAIVGSYAGQSLLDRSGVRTVAVSASVLLVFACLLLTQISAGGSYFADLFGGLSLFGAGLGAGTVAASVAALADVPDQDAGVASASNTAAFQLGGAFGAAVVTTVVHAYTDGTNVLGRLMVGFQAGFVTCSVAAALGLLVALVALGRPRYRFQPASGAATQGR